MPFSVSFAAIFNDNITYRNCGKLHYAMFPSHKFQKRLHKYIELCSPQYPKAWVLVCLPGFLLTGIDSPVIRDSSQADKPSITLPSTGNLPPGTT